MLDEVARRVVYLRELARHMDNWRCPRQYA